MLKPKVGWAGALHGDIGRLSHKAIQIPPKPTPKKADLKDKFVEESSPKDGREGHSTTSTEEEKKSTKALAGNGGTLNRTMRLTIVVTPAWARKTLSLWL